MSKSKTVKNIKENIRDNITDNIKSINIVEIPFWLVGALFSLFTIIFFWDILIGNNYFWEDFIEYVYPVQAFAAKEFSKFIIPFWNPYSFSGMPFLADLQVGFFYPLNRILSLFLDFNNNLPYQAVQYVIILHFLISQISMYFLAKHLKISSIGAILSSIAYAFSMIMVCHVIHPMIIYHLSWFPLIIKYYYKGINKNKIQSSIVAGLIFGITILSGHPQTTIYEALFLGFLFIFLLIEKIYNSKNEKPKYHYLIPAGIIPIIIGFGIYAIQYFPSKELAEQSVRNEINYEKSIEGSLEFKNAFTMIIPNLFGTVDGESMTQSSLDKQPSFYQTFGKERVQYHFFWETSYYFGIITFILGLYALFFEYKRVFGIFLIFISAFGFLYSLGDNSFVYKIMYSFPFLGNFRNPGRILFFTIIGFSLLAGFGFDNLWKNYKTKYSLIKLLIACSIPLIIGLVASSGALSYPNTPLELISQIKSTGTIVIIISLVIVILSLLLNKILNPLIIGLILVIISFIDLYSFGNSFNKGTINPEKAYELNPEMKSLLTPKLPKDIFRVNMRVYNPSFMAMKRNQGLIDGIMLVEGYNPLLLYRSVISFYDKKANFDIFNVKYEIKIDFQKGSWNFEQRDTSYGHCWFVNNYKVSNSESIKKELKNNNIDFRELVYLEEKPDIEIDTAKVYNSNIECLEYSSNKLIYKVFTEKNKILLLSEITYPGWKAYIDGQSTKIMNANYSFRAIAIPSGEHIIEMKYDSESFRIGSIITISTLLISIISFVILNVRKNHI